MSLFVQIKTNSCAVITCQEQDRVPALLSCIPTGGGSCNLQLVTEIHILPFSSQQF